MGLISLFKNKTVVFKCLVGCLVFSVTLQVWSEENNNDRCASHRINNETVKKDTTATQDQKNKAQKLLDDCLAYSSAEACKDQKDAFEEVRKDMTSACSKAQLGSAGKNCVEGANKCNQFLDGVSDNRISSPFSSDDESDFDPESFMSSMRDECRPFASSKIKPSRERIDSLEKTVSSLERELERAQREESERKEAQTNEIAELTRQQQQLDASISSLEASYRSAVEKMPNVQNNQRLEFESKLDQIRARESEIRNNFRKNILGLQERIRKSQTECQAAYNQEMQRVKAANQGRLVSGSGHSGAIMVRATEAKVQRDLKICKSEALFSSNSEARVEQQAYNDAISMHNQERNLQVQNYLNQVDLLQKNATAEIKDTLTKLETATKAREQLANQLLQKTAGDTAVFQSMQKQSAIASKLDAKNKELYSTQTEYNAYTAIADEVPDSKEFYLPQLAHEIMGLESTYLERLEDYNTCKGVDAKKGTWEPLKAE